MVGRDSSNPYYRIMVQIKNNLAPEGKAFVFELNPDLGFSWIGQEEHEMEYVHCWGIQLQGGHIGMIYVSFLGKQGFQLKKFVVN